MRARRLHSARACLSSVTRERAPQEKILHTAVKFSASRSGGLYNPDTVQMLMEALSNFQLREWRDIVRRIGSDKAGQVLEALVSPARA